MNMTKSFSQVLLLTAFCMLSFGSWAQFMEIKEHAAEIQSLDIGNAATTNGLIYIRRCDQCSQVGVSFRAQTRFYDGKQSITALDAEALAGRGATVLYDVQSRYVTRVIFWPVSN